VKKHLIRHLTAVVYTQAERTHELLLQNVSANYVLAAVYDFSIPRRVCLFESGLLFFRRPCVTTPRLHRRKICKQ